MPPPALPLIRTEPPAGVYFTALVKKIDKDLLQALPIGQDEIIDFLRLRREEINGALHRQRLDQLERFLQGETDAHWFELRAASGRFRSG